MLSNEDMKELRKELSKINPEGKLLGRRSQCSMKEKSRKKQA